MRLGTFFEHLFPGFNHTMHDHGHVFYSQIILFSSPTRKLKSCRGRQQQQHLHIPEHPLLPATTCAVLRPSFCLHSRRNAGRVLRGHSPSKAHRERARLHATSKQPPHVCSVHEPNAKFSIKFHMGSGKVRISAFCILHHHRYETLLRHQLRITPL